MICSIIYYIAYKTGYIQRCLDKKLATVKNMEQGGVAAAVSAEDFRGKLEESLESSDFVIVVGGLTAGGDRNVMTVMSDYFNDKEMDVTFNKRVINPDGGKDGYLIRSGDKYIAVLPDEPEQVDKMMGSELLSNINISPNTTAQLPEPVRTHTVVFAPEQYDPLEQLNKRRTPNILVAAAVIFGALTVVAAVVWIITQYL